MIGDLDLALQEMTTLKTQAEDGVIDRDRWLDFIAYLKLLGCLTLAASVETSLRIYEGCSREWLRVMDVEMPAMAERE